MTRDLVLKALLDTGMNENLNISQFDKHIKSRTLTNVYRGMTIPKLLKVGDTVKLFDLGCSYSYSFDVAWDFALASEKYRPDHVKVIFNVDDMKHIDLKSLSAEFNLPVIYEVMINEEEEVVCVDDSTYKVIYVNTHQSLTSEIYEIGLRKVVT